MCDLPPTQQPDDCDPASLPYQEREFRFIRNHIVRRDSVELCRVGSKGKLADQVFVNKESGAPQHLLFHPYLPQLAVFGKQTWRWVLHVLTIHACNLVT